MRELDPVNLRGHFEEFRKTHTMRRCTRCATLPLRFPRFEALCDQENLLMAYRGMGCNYASRRLRLDQESPMSPPRPSDPAFAHQTDSYSILRDLLDLFALEETEAFREFVQEHRRGTRDSHPGFSNTPVMLTDRTPIHYFPSCSFSLIHLFIENPM